MVAEITVEGDHDFYDFAAKYLPEESTRLDVPAELDAAVADEVRRLAAAAFEALSCEGLARVDFFLLADGRLVINEINTMPGFTPTSMFPRMWAASGLAYPDAGGPAAPAGAAAGGPACADPSRIIAAARLSAP